jgi:hypothetical protein
LGDGEGGAKVMRKIGEQVVQIWSGASPSSGKRRHLLLRRCLDQEMLMLKNYIVIDIIYRSCDKLDINLSIHQPSHYLCPNDYQDKV